MRTFDGKRVGRGLAIAALGAAVTLASCLQDGGDGPESSASSAGETVETHAALLPPGPGPGPMPCTPGCGVCVADSSSATGCSKPCRATTCAVTRTDCPASFCPPPPPTCAAGQTLCGNTCSDLGWDPGNCGACGNACPAGGTCELGQCYPKPPGCGACVAGSQTCCQYISSDEQGCWTQSCTPPPCAAGAVCDPSGTGQVCSCATGQTCARRCGPPICEVDWTLCILSGGPLCFPICHPGICSIDSFCQ